MAHSCHSKLFTPCHSERLVRRSLGEGGSEESRIQEILICLAVAATATASSIRRKASCGESQESSIEPVILSAVSAAPTLPDPAAKPSPGSPLKSTSDSASPSQD